MLNLNTCALLGHILYFIPELTVEHKFYAFFKERLVNAASFLLLKDTIKIVMSRNGQEQLQESDSERLNPSCISMNSAHSCTKHKESHALLRGEYQKRLYFCS
jgi:hypothetical protein